MINEPLGLPQGSVRAILAIMSVAGMFLAIFRGVENIEAITVIVGVIVTFYFKTRPDGMTELEKLELLRRKGE